MNNKNQKGFTHHILLIGLAVVVTGAIGFAGFRVYKSKNDINAKAAGYKWTDLTNLNMGAKGGGTPKSNVTYYGCKMASSATANKVYIKAVKVKDGNVPTITLGVFMIAADGTYLKGSGNAATNNTWARGTTLQLNVIATTSPKEYVNIGYNDGFGGYSMGIDPAVIGNCTSR